MAGSCLLHPPSPGAIALPQFVETFRRVWLESRASWAGRRQETRLPRRVGLAVSGGADSMALAYLCRQWEANHHRDHGVTVTAFVVDHKAREESSREAGQVTRWLTDLGVKTQILELTWPDSTKSPAQMSAFETHARRLRFQALGRACRDNQIETLLMGHHQDDNVETTIWRLCSGARGAGLGGIPPVTRIPECHGIHGVSESGSSSILQPRQRTIRVTADNEIQYLKDEHEASSTVSEVSMSTGGISICRPLLSFPKDNLLATCHENNVPHVSDPTNFDPTLTPRNAIRSLLSSNRLPHALQSASILSLVKTSQTLLQDSIDLSNRLLQQCKILDLNLPAGTMMVQFPQSYSPDPTTKSRNHQVQTLTLRRITDLISPFPENHFPLRSFEPFISRVFLSGSSNATKRLSFTLGGVMFQPLQWDPDHIPRDDLAPNTTTLSPDQNNIWLLSRQPYMRNRLPNLRFDVPAPSSLTIPGSGPDQSQEIKSSSQLNYSPWHLWDDRYWFRFAVIPDESGFAHYQKQTENRTEITSVSQSIPLVIRPFQLSDLQFIRRVVNERFQHMSGSSKAKDPELISLLRRLGIEAPGPSRFTLPLLVIEKGLGGFDHDIPLALPTLQLWFPGMLKSLSAPQQWKIQWEWMYKMVDSSPLKLMGGL